jgi:DNA-binding helix-hairpin-helix protein with protein kinase domain
MAELKAGEVLKIEKHKDQDMVFKDITVETQLGDGGQGWVYRVDCEGKKLALKWYKPGALNAPGDFRTNLENNINKGAPDGAFLWPLGIVQKGGDFGYLMGLRPDAYKDFSKILVGREMLKDGQIRKLGWPGVGPMVNAAMNISAGFRSLHARGYSYQDLNDGNFFVNLTEEGKMGDVLICDNDNVSAYGVASGIKGKARYMAPEVVLGTSDPNPKTDAFSLAVILFLLFVKNHPLEGKAALACDCLDEKAERKIYGEHPVFIFDPRDESNAPDPAVHLGAFKRWPFLPRYAQDLFIKAFSQEAMHDPARRVLEIDWIRLFIRMRGELWLCPSCGTVYFADPVNSNPCPGCQKPTIFPFYIKTSGGYILPIHARTRLYKCHSSAQNAEGFNEITGEILVRGNEMGLKNVTPGERWAVISGSTKTPLEPGRAVKIEPGITVDFGAGASAEIAAK